MALDGTQVEALHRALCLAYDASTLERMLRFRLDKHLDWIAPAAGFETVVFEVIVLAEQQGWHLDLIREAYCFNRDNPDLRVFVQSFAPEWLPCHEAASGPAAPVHGPVATTPALSPFLSCFLYDRLDMPLVNRLPFRNALEALDNDQATIVAVHGPPRSGKTYSRYLVTHVAGNSEKVKPVYIDLTEQGYTPDRLALNIVLEIDPDVGADGVTVKASQDPRWAKELSRYIVGKAQATGAQWWIVLDGIHQRDQPPETLELIKQLALRAATPVDCLRLVLLGCRPELLPPDTRLWLVEDRLDALEPLDLRQFFETALQERGTTFLPDALDPAVQYVVDRLPPPYTGNTLERLPELVREAVSLLLG